MKKIWFLNTLTKYLYLVFIYKYNFGHSDVFLFIHPLSAVVCWVSIVMLYL